MLAIKLKGKITADGKLEVELPSGMEAEDVLVTIERVHEPAAEDVVWTEEELAELLQPHAPLSGAEIAAQIMAEGGGWEDKGITDSQKWVEEQRKKRAATPP
jgi:hypothetical protein